MSGRPTKHEQAKIKETIYDLRSKGFEASYVIAKTRFSKNTVYTYIKEFDETWFVDDQISLGQLQSRILYDIDKTVDELYLRQEMLKKEEEALLAKQKPVPRHIHTLMLDIIKEISRNKEKKWLILGGPCGKNFDINKKEMTENEKSC